LRNAIEEMASIVTTRSSPFGRSRSKTGVERRFKQTDGALPLHFCHKSFICAPDVSPPDTATAVAEPAASAPPLPWRLADIDFSRLEHEKARDDETLFFLLATSALVEAATYHYASNLIEYYAGDAELASWLRAQWQPEELQHGRALRAYVEAVWPEFSWERAFGGFYPEYSAACTQEELEASRALEMAARCVVETGTSTLYQTLNTYATEPVLREITAKLKADEVRHYSYFYDAYRRYCAANGRPSRWRVARALLRRVLEAFADDGDIAFRHAWNGRYPDRPSTPEDYRRFQKAMRERITPNLPVTMSTKMLLKPLALPPWLNGWAVSLVGGVLRLAAGRPRESART
jgi:hypothetical protein